MRILWVSNAPWTGSGYGTQTDMFTRRFVEAGHDVAIAANHGLSNMPTSWHGIPVYPSPDPDSIQTFAKHFDADTVISLYDTWVMNPSKWPEVRMAMWAPVDHEPPPMVVLNVLGHERVRPIAMSRNGEMWMKKSDLDPLYVPHGVDTEVFKPIPEAKAEFRKVLDLPEDAFVVGMVAANSGWNPDVSRKAFPQAFDAFGKFLETHDDAYLYVHSRMHGGTSGQDLKFVAGMMSIPPERLKYPPPNMWHLGIMDQQWVCGVYNSFDVLLNPSMGEGFGIPIIEAQACGVPVIASNHSAMKELCQNGWLVQGDRWLNGPPLLSFAFIPHVASIVDCLEQAYENRDNQALRDAARQFALTYDVDRVMEEYWVPVLDELAKPAEVKPFPRPASRQVRRAAERKAAKR